MPVTTFEYGKRGNQLRRSLNKADGFEFTGPTTGSLAVGENFAHVRLEPDGSIRVELAAPPPVNYRRALEVNNRLNGNVRLACDRRGASVLADTQVDGEVHLSESFRQIGEGMLEALGHSNDSHEFRNPEPVLPESVSQALKAMSCSSDSLVQHELGWELRSRCQDEIVPVQLSISGPDLVVWNTLISNWPDDGEQGTEQQAAHYALCLNGRLRHVRLALADGRLVAETRLHSRLITPHWLRQSAAAVACATQYVLPTLRVLLGQPLVRELYSWLFQPEIASESNRADRVAS